MLSKNGCRIGKGTRLISDEPAIGSELYWVAIREDCLFSSNVNLFTYDDDVEVLNALSSFEKKILHIEICLNVLFITG